MHLVDTNLLLEALLTQQRAAEVGRFLDRAQAGTLFVTDFAIHSVGIALIARRMHQQFADMVADLILSGRIAVIHLEPEDLSLVVRAAQRFNLDFDDAYQYAAAEKNNLTIVSFDADFDRTERGRKVPAQLLA